MALPNEYGDNDAKSPEQGDSTRMPGLAAWVAAKVEVGRRDRDTKYESRWKEYTRLWRGFWVDRDKNTDSERSKLIAPALQQAIEMTVAEIEEAVFSKQAWFDIEDDMDDKERNDAVVFRDRLLEDMELDSVPDSVSKCFLLGAIYGTGIAKINVQRKYLSEIRNGEEVRTPRVSVTAEPIRPDEFIIDPVALSVEDALYVAHDMVKPAHQIRQKQKEGKYYKTMVGPYTGSRADTDGTGKNTTFAAEDNGVLITEYFGKVPGRFFGKKGMVEAIVTIANNGILLKAIESPFTMKDRPIIAYQHDTVPGEFWGRGVAEKGYNPQKALDAEMRARIDALALITAPMMGADITRLPRNADMRVRPGKTIFTRGRPSEVFEAVNFGSPQILAQTFQQSADLERMVQVGTGAMDSAIPVGQNRRNETASGMSMLQSGFIKRSKRTMQNLERQFLDPLVKKSLWRYMQFDPERYPSDMKFKVNATMGIMAKEVENSQLINMLGFVPPEHPAHTILIKAIFDNSASANKRELNEAMQQAMQPPSKEEKELQQLQQQLQIEAAKEEVMNQKLENAKLKAQIDEIQAKTRHTNIKAELEDDLVDIQAANAATAAEKTRVSREQIKQQKQEKKEND